MRSAGAAAPVLLFLLLPLAGCLEGGTPPGGDGANATTTTTTFPTATTPPPASVENLSRRSLDKGAFSGVHEDVRSVLRTQAEWDALWARHRGNGSTPAPRVEFGNESVVAVVVRGPTGCFGVHVGSVTFDERARRTTVEVVRERTPPHVNCVTTLEDAYHFVAIPTRPGDAEFMEKEEDADVGGGAPAEYAFRTVAHGGASGIREATRLVVRDAAAWRALWANHSSTQDPAPAAPAHDFSKEALFVAIGPERSNTCWAVRVARIVVGPAETEVHVATYAPPPGMMCGQALSQPFHVVTYPLDAPPLRVVESEHAGPAPNV